jgi:RNA polymerase sigma factor for flagellar operon FliA
MFLLHQGLVRAIAWKTHRRVPHQVDVDDLIAYGQIGLLEAINAFDAKLGRKFTTYAWHRIRGAMLDGLGKMAWYDRGTMERGGYETKPEVAKPAPAQPGPSTAALEGKAPPPAPPTSEAGRQAAPRRRPARSDFDTGEVPSRDEEAGDAVARRETVLFLRSLIESLPEKEAGLLLGTFYEGRTLTEAARRIGISKAWASRLQTRTLADLRIALERAGFG